MILDRYLGRALLANSLLALFLLLAISAFFTFVDQLGDTGRGNYDLAGALFYVLLTLPAIGYELLPVATVIGGMTALGMLANNGELAVIRASGVSQMQLARSLMKTGLWLVIAAFVIGEFIAPGGGRIAERQRSVALAEQITLQTKNGLWARNGNRFINIRTLLPDDRFEDIYIYEFDDSGKLTATTHAKRGAYRDGKWLLREILQTDISARGTAGRRYQDAEWPALFEPEVIGLIALKPRYLSIYGLFGYIRHLKENNQSSRLYAQTLWKKIIAPFSILVMILLAVCIVKCEGRAVGLGQRVFVGALVGIVFHLLNQVSGHLGIVYGLPAFIGAGLPSALALAGIGYKLRRDRCPARGKQTLGRPA